MSWSKESRHSRGYDRSWELTRLQVLSRDNGLCQCDQCKGKMPPTRATEVDHIKPKAQCKAEGWTKAQTDDMSNLRSVSKECHRRITAEQCGRKHTPKRAFGPDGYPIKEAK